MRRVSPWYIFTLPVFLLLCWINIQLSGFLPLPTAFGTVSGILVGGSLSLRALRALAEKGEYRTTRKQWIAAWAADSVTAVGALLLTFWFLSLEGMLTVKAITLAFSFFYPAFFGTQGVIFLAWETKNGKHITWEGYKLYAVHKNSAY